MLLFNGNKKYFSLHKIDLRVAKVIYVNFAGYGNLDHIFVDNLVTVVGIVIEIIKEKIMVSVELWAVAIYLMIFR